MKTALLTTFLAFSLAGCLTQPPAPTVDRTPVAQSRAAPVTTPVAEAPAATADLGRTYTVKRGDRLFRIALEHGLDYRELASWNGIADPSAIKEGQVLRLTPPGSEGTGVVAKPIAAAPLVEARSLDTPAKVSGATSSDSLKREPKVGKEPYSDEAHARLNRTAGSASAPEKTAIAEPAKPADKPLSAAQPVSPDDLVWIWPANGPLLQGFGQSGNKGIDLAGKAGDPVLAAAEGRVVYAGAGLPGYGELVIVKHNATFLSAYAHNRKILVKEGQSVTRGQKIAEMGSTGTDTVKLHFEIRRQGNPIDPMPLLPKK